MAPAPERPRGRGLTSSGCPARESLQATMPFREVQATTYCAPVQAAAQELVPTSSLTSATRMLGPYAEPDGAMRVAARKPSVLNMTRKSVPSLAIATAPTERSTPPYVSGASG